MNDQISVSIVVPVFNEAQSLELFYNELKSSILDYKHYEIIFIDDGSDDNSFQIIKNSVVRRHLYI